MPRHHLSSSMLPLELVELVIDNLCNDRTTLSACSLVCKAWISRSRYHLFCDLLLSKNELSIDILAQTPFSAPALAARRLMLSGYNVPPSGIESFNSIKEFFLTLSTPKDDLLDAIPLSFRNITVLELNQSIFPSFAQMVQLICALPNLETLTQFMCTWLQEVDVPPSNLQLSPRLRTMNIHSLRLHVFLNWLNDVENLPAISTVLFYGIAEPHMIPIARTIRRLDNSLEDLTLDLWDSRHADLLAESIDLSHSIKLRSFTLRNAWPKLLQNILVSHTHQSGLRKITLIMYEGKGNIPNLDLLDWTGLDKLLTAPTTAFHVLDMIVRIYTHSLFSYVDRDMVENRFMPRCGAAGLVRYVSERERSLGVREKMKGPISQRSWTEEISS